MALQRVRQQVVDRPYAEEDGKHGALLVVAGQAQAAPPLSVEQFDVHVGDELGRFENVTCGGMKVTRPPEASWGKHQRGGGANSATHIQGSKKDGRSTGTPLRRAFV